MFDAGAGDAEAPDASAHDASPPDAGIDAGPSCTDGLTNGDETDIDCGGATCPPCAEGAACSARSDCLTDRCVEDRCTVPEPITPVAPCGTEFMYPGRQDAFVAGAGITCTGSVAIGMLPDSEDFRRGAVCYARPDGELVCSGTIAGRSFSREEPAGVPDVVQVLALSPDAVCALQADGDVWCMGQNSISGTLGVGTIGNVPDFAWWGAGAPAGVRAITHASGAVCGLTAGAELYCSGYQMGTGTAHALVPGLIARDVDAVYPDRFGRLLIRSLDGSAYEYDPSTDTSTAAPFDACRVGPVWPDYLVRTAGVVDGVYLQVETSSTRCELRDDGLAHCGLAMAFGGERVLAVALHPSITTELFGVRQDGALLDLIGAEVVPPGSVRVPTCD